MFGTVPHGGFITEHANFETFANSLLLMYRMITGKRNIASRGLPLAPRVNVQAWSFTPPSLDSHVLSAGESWNGIMHDCTGAVGPIWAILFFCSFVVLGQFTVLNMFVAVILENFEREMASESATQMVGLRRGCSRVGAGDSLVSAHRLACFTRRTLHCR